MPERYRPEPKPFVVSVKDKPTGAASPVEAERMYRVTVLNCGSVFVTKELKSHSANAALAKVKVYHLADIREVLESLGFKIDLSFTVETLDTQTTLF